MANEKVFKEDPKPVVGDKPNVSNVNPFKQINHP